MDQLHKLLDNCALKQAEINACKRYVKNCDFILLQGALIQLKTERDEMANHLENLQATFSEAGCDDYDLPEDRLLWPLGLVFNLTGSTIG